MKLGIFGGTFNPPHIGHLILAETAADNLKLDKVLFVPAAEPPHKVGVPRASVEHRLKMLELTIANNPLLELSRVDVDRPGPHYTADTVEIFQRTYSGADLYFLMGSDSLRDLLTWHDPERLIRQCCIVVMSRPVIPPDMDILYAELPDLRKKLISVNSPEIDISSTNIVARIKTGKSIRYRVRESVWEYIYANRLYRED